VAFAVDCRVGLIVRLAALGEGVGVAAVVVAEGLERFPPTITSELSGRRLS
jgi:hypothetical protein